MRLLAVLFLLPLTSYASDCTIPFNKAINSKTGTHFNLQDVYNDSPSVKDMYRQRYIVVNLNTVDAAGNCKGIQEHYPSGVDANVFPELNNGNDLQSYTQSILPHYKEPVSKGTTANHGGSLVCIGQTVTLCEIRNGQPVEVAKLGTSSADYGNSVPKLSGYYSEINYINTRSWAVNRPGYTAVDAARDMEMGGVESGKMSGARFVPYNGWVMPNFMNFVAMPGYSGNPQNGLHEISNGESRGSNLGAPVSHGCLRLTKYGAILLRWWLPRNARMFIDYDQSGYRKYASVNGQGV